MRLFSKKQPFAVPEGLSAEELLALAQLEEDPVRRHQYLVKAESLAPDHLGIRRALLMHGRLHERGGKALDFSVIKSYLFHVFEHPEQHDEQEIQRFTHELLSSPQLTACLRLTDDPDAFMQNYLEELARDYIRLFILPDTSHAPVLLGFMPQRRLPGYMARPAKDILLNILSSSYLTTDEQLLVARQFYKAFHREMDGQTAELDRLLGPEVCRALG